MTNKNTSATINNIMSYVKYADDNAVSQLCSTPICKNDGGTTSESIYLDMHALSGNMKFNYDGGKLKTIEFSKTLNNRGVDQIPQRYFTYAKRLLNLARAKARD